MTESLQRYLAELFGTFTLVFVGSLSILSFIQGDTGVVCIAIGFGLALLAGLYAFGELSGGHYNPIVSLAMALERRLGARELVPYWIAQFAGAVLASLCVLIAFDSDAVETTTTRVGPGVGTWSAVFLEMLVSAVFVLVILQATRSEKFGGTALLAISLALVAAHAALVPLTGASLNTARSFGPALVGTYWTNFWVYLVGPPLGAVVGWAVYTIVNRRGELAAKAA
jgi:MIP family channel proteins